MINRLFELGLKCFHIRKPHYDETILESYLQEINPVYHSMIVLHSHHKLAEKYALKGVHFRESDRKDFFKKTVSQRKEEIEYWGLKGGDLVSTSIHTIEDLKKESHYFEYVLISPVFESISKQGYTPRVDWDVNVLKTKIQPQMIALGGVDLDKISLVAKKGFDGVAVLGAVWKNNSKVLDNFKKIHDKCQEIESLY